MEKIEGRNQKHKQVLQHIPTCNITELNVLIYAEANLVCDIISISQGNLNKNTRPGWEIRLEGQINVTTIEHSKEGKTYKNIFR